MTSPFSSFEIINVVPNPKVFFRIAASIADVAAATPKGCKTFLVSDVVHFLLVVNQISLMSYRLSILIDNFFEQFLLVMLLYFRKI